MSDAAVLARVIHPLTMPSLWLPWLSTDSIPICGTVSMKRALCLLFVRYRLLVGGKMATYSPIQLSAYSAHCIREFWFSVTM